MQSEFVFAQVNALFFFELISKVVDDAGVEIFTAEECVAVCGFDLKYAVADFKD